MLPANSRFGCWLAISCGASEEIAFGFRSRRFYCESYAFTVNLIQMPAARPLRGNRR